MHIKTSTTVKLAKTKYFAFRSVDCKKESKVGIINHGSSSGWSLLGILVGESGGRPLLFTRTLCQPVDRGGRGGDDIPTREVQSGDVQSLTKKEDVLRDPKGYHLSIMRICQTNRKAPVISDGIIL